MTWLDLSYLLTGVFLCLLVFGQIAFWSSETWRSAWRSGKEFRNWQHERRARLDQAAVRRQESAGVLPAGEAGGWRGWRQFRVAELKRETPSSQSVYLVPADGKPLPRFRAGQYLTIRIQLPEERRPQIRCYSLSSPPGRLPYRITVKQASPCASQPPQGKLPRSVSTYINQGLRVGDLIEAKAPAGEFVWQPVATRPVVMIAAGVGITPIYSMLCALLEDRTDSSGPHPVILFYGNTDSSEVIFDRELACLAATHSRLVIVNCHSQAELRTQTNELPCHFRERISLDLIRRLLPSLDFEFYLCGPPGLMQSLYPGLVEAGVPPEQIHFEAFGPASVRPVQARDPLEQERAVADSLAGLIAFTRSNKTVEYPTGRSILELAEDCEVPIDSGCRSGNCGTCAVKLLKGSVRYPHPSTLDLEPGVCLACIAQPEGEVVVEA